MENTENKLCKWCGNPKNWLRWAIGLAILIFVFCIGCMAGRFVHCRYQQGGYYGGPMMRGGYQQDGYYGGSMMRGNRYNRYYAPRYTNGLTPAETSTPTTDASTTPAQQ